MKRYCLLFLFAFSFLRVSAQGSDLQVCLHESMINKLLAALGNFSGSADYKVWFFKGTYKWTVMNPHIELKPGKADYICDVKVEDGPFDYQTQVIGDAEVSYDQKTNLISVKITKGIFEIYTVILGRKFHITQIDLANYYTDPLTFEGPMTMGTSMEFTMPDNSKKTIYITPAACLLNVEHDQVIVKCQVQFSEIPPKQ